VDWCQEIKASPKREQDEPVVSDLNARPRHGITRHHRAPYCQQHDAPPQSSLSQSSCSPSMPLILRMEVTARDRRGL
jgi:hypothetical protein